VQGTTDPVSIVYSLFRDGEYLFDTEPTDEQIYTLITDIPGVYRVNALVTHESGAYVFAEGNQLLVTSVQPSSPTAWEDLPEGLIEGGDYSAGVVASGFIAGSKEEEDALKAVYAYLNELSVAFASINQAFLTAGQTATIVARATGGDG
jgi:hypothetical protein